MPAGPGVPRQGQAQGRPRPSPPGPVSLGWPGGARVPPLPLTAHHWQCLLHLVCSVLFLLSADPVLALKPLFFFYIFIYIDIYIFFNSIC